MHTNAMAPYFDYEVYPGKTINSDSELLEIARKRSTTAYHLMGSCRMGPNTDPERPMYRICPPMDIHAS